MHYKTKIVYATYIERGKPPNIQYVLVIPFNSPILLGIIHTSSLLDDTFRGMKGGHDKLKTIVRTCSFDQMIVLCFNLFNKIHNMLSCFTFGFNPNNPSISSVIIHDSQK